MTKSKTRLIRKEICKLSKYEFTGTISSIVAFLQELAKNHSYEASIDVAYCGHEGTEAMAQVCRE